MDTRENMQDNYRQPQAEGDDQQTIIVDPALHQQVPPIDPEDEESDEDTEDSWNDLSQRKKQSIRPH